MNKFVILLILVLGFSHCSKDKGKSAHFPQSPNTPSSFGQSGINGVNLWHLEAMPALGGARNFNPGEVTLEFDTISSILTVDGSMNNIYVAKGKYAYVIKDSTFMIFNPRLNSYYPSVRKIIKLDGVNRGVMFYSIYNRQLSITWDFNLDIADEENSYLFRQY